MVRKFKRPAGKRNFKKKGRIAKIKPWSDPRLKKVFASIGIPGDKEFVPDPFQLKALEVIETADCLVTAPTGSGKTWIAENAIDRIYAKGGRAWYASPLKALTNGIFKSLCDKFGSGNVGILTGDRKENPNAPIIVGTTEILRNHLYDAMYLGEDLATDFVILDEAHFLGDEDRGVVWEEIMIYLPQRIPLLMLSATIGNAFQIAGWLKSIRRHDCVVVEEKKRPVPLYPLFFHPSGTLLPFLTGPSSDKKRSIYKKVLSYIESKNSLVLSTPGKLPPMGDIIRVLSKYNLMPAIFFMKSRADCDSALDLCTEVNLQNDPERKEKLKNRIAELLESAPHLRDHRHIWQLENLGVGAHHSGQLPAWKILVETLMSEGLLDSVFATSTVAAGVNFPARSVVILNSDRFNGTEFQSLTSTEFHQMTGRSGRRGMDKIGFAVLLPGKFMDLRLVAKLLNSPPLAVNSQIKINFSMVLNLMMSHTPGQIKELLQKSFASYVASKKKRTKKIFYKDQNYLLRDFLQHLNFLKENDYVTEEDELSEEGKWAARLRVDQPLMIAQGFRREIFPDDDPAMLAAVIASFVNDRDGVDEHLDKSLVPKKLVNHFLTVKKSLRTFTRDMIASGFSVKTLCLQPAFIVYLWASGKSFEDVVKVSSLAEGDLARLIFRTADNLRHIRNLSEYFPKIAETAGISVKAILKEPIVSYY